MAAISHTTVSNAFSWMKSFVFQFKFHWGFFSRVQLTINQNRWQAITWTNANPGHWRIYAAIGGDELTLVVMYLFGEKYVYIYAFSIISQHWIGLSCWKHSLWKTRLCLSCIVNAMATDGLLTQGDRTLVEAVSIQFSRKIVQFECTPQHTVAVTPHVNA